MKKRFFGCLFLLFVAFACDDDGKTNKTNNANNLNNANNINNTNNVNNINNVNNANNLNNLNNLNNTNNTTAVGSRRVDLLFVIDTSMSMVDDQMRLELVWPAFFAELAGTAGGMPDLHLGVISPDLGAGLYNIPTCQTPGGDNGLLLRGAQNACINPLGQNFVVDIAPRGCTVTRDVDGACQAHDCAQANCDVEAFLEGETPTEPEGLQLVLDDAGCPRCRNYTEETLAQVMDCLANLGGGGCGFEQPLEAMNTALNSWTADNLGFLRGDAVFSVMFFTDEDDCSASDPSLFDPNADAALGPLSSFRCVEHGIVCDEPWSRSALADYTNCRSRPEADTARMLHPVARYVDTLRALKGDIMTYVTALAGPVDGTVSVEMDLNDNPMELPSCESNDNGATPAIRLQELVLAFHPGDPEAFASICSEDLLAPLTGLATRVRRMVESLPQP